MKTNVKRAISLALALMMIFAIAAPVTMAGEIVDPPANVAPVGNLDGKVVTVKPDKTTVIVHKLMAETYVEGIPFDHNGGVLSPEQLAQIGTQVTEANGVEFSYYKVTAEQLDALILDKDNNATVAAVNATLTVAAPTGVITTAGGVGATVELEDGYYWFVESKKPETLKNAGGTVPFGISVPLPNGIKVGNIEAGAGFLSEVNIYPKNVNETPVTDKTFGDDNKADKERDYNIGDAIPYEVVTTFPAGTRYKTAHWNDRMTEGLTLDPDSIVVKIGDTILTKVTDYEVDATDTSFSLKLTDPAGLARINEQATKTTVTITYNAVLNEKAVVDIPESNDVMFFYGNNPDHGNTPVTTKPRDKQITVNKTWVDANGADLTPPAGVTAEMTLINAQTGETVGAPVVLNGTETPAWTHTWTDLDDDTEYKVLETYNGYSAEYLQLSDEPNIITVKNWKDDNPTPNNPEEPKVFTYGKKFVKTGDADARLEGAEFVVYKNADAPNYLKKKTDPQTANDLAAYLTAQAAYLAEVAKQPQDPAALAAAKVARDIAFEAKNMQWTWTTVKEEAVVFRSNAQGQFEVYGLEAGDYFLQETKAPEGYSAITTPIPFAVGKNSYTQGDFAFIEGETPTTAQKVPNKKVTIPQTGGIGTAIFIVAGIALMGTAVIGLRKRPQED